MHVDPDVWPVTDERPPRVRPENIWMLSFGTFVGAVATVAALAWLVAVSWPGGNLLLQIGAALVAMAVGVAWVGLVLTSLILRLGHRPTGGGIGLAVAVVALVVVVVATATHLPLRVRFALSSNSFDRALEATDADGTRDLPHRIGLYGAASVSREGGDTTVNVLDGGVGLSGFVHSTEGSPGWLDPSDGLGSHVLSLGDGWYAFWHDVD